MAEVDPRDVLKTVRRRPSRQILRRRYFIEFIFLVVVAALAFTGYLVISGQVSWQ